MQKTHVLNKSRTKEFADLLAQNANSGNVFGLKGTLGAGKSFVAKYFINALQDEKTEILSPTFNILLSYQTKKGLVHHFDLYRIKNVEELENIGFFECLKNGICLVEWPEIIENFLKEKLQENYIQIEIKIKNEEEREIIIT